MSGSGESWPVNPWSYGSLLMRVFDGVDYIEVDMPVPPEFEEAGIRINEITRRGRSAFDPQQGVHWTLHDVLNDTNIQGDPRIRRLLAMQKLDRNGELTLRLSDDLQEVSIMKTDYTLPPDFNAADEFMEGLEVLTGPGSRLIE